MAIKQIFQKFIKISIYSLVFLLPLLYLPFVFSYELNKYYLLFFLTSLSLLAWGAKTVLRDMEIRLRFSPLELPVLLFLFIGILSTAFSLEKSISLFGSHAGFANSLAGLLSFGAFYFLIINNINKEIGSSMYSYGTRTEEGTSSLLKAFFYSCVVVVATSYLSIFRIWEKISVKYPILLQRTFNLVSFSSEGLAIFLSIALVLLVGAILCFGSKFKKKFFYVLLVAVSGILILIDFTPAWIILLASLSVFLIFGLAGKMFRDNINQLLVPIVLIFIAIAFLFLNVRNITNPESFFFFPQEQLLEQKTSWKIALGTVKSSFKNFILGSGLGTWQYDFLKEKPLEFNNNILWNTRFNSAGSYIAELFATTGIFGIISYLLLIGIFFSTFWSLQNKKEALPYAVGFLAVLLGQIFYYQNAILSFVFWLVLSLSIASWKIPGRVVIKKPLSYERFPELALVCSVILILFFIFIFGAHYFLAKIYLADVNYAKAQTADSIEESIGFLEKAADLNPQIAIYQTTLARAYLMQVSNELAKPAEEQDKTVIQATINQGISQAAYATTVLPNDISTWETLGSVYRDLQFVVEGAIDLAIQSFEKAIEIEGTNPILYTELGKAYLNSENVEKAKESFAKARELKADYLQAPIQEALIYEEEEVDTAISKLEELDQAYPLNTEVKFQLGRIYFNQEEIDKAIPLFITVLQVNPNHSNALYSLAKAYEQKGETDTALLFFERVLELNPGNAEIIEKLQELKGED